MNEEEHLLIRILRRAGTHTLVALFLLLIALATVVGGLTDIVRTLQMAPLFWMMVIALLTGWLLGSSSLAFWKSGLLGSLTGVLGIILSLGRMAGPVVQALIRWIELSVEIWRWLLIKGAEYPNSAPFALAFADLSAGLYALAARLNAWIYGLMSASATFDPLMTIMLWSLLIWLISSWAGWIVRRRGQPLLALGPATVLLVGLMNYTGGDAKILLPLLGSILALMALESQHWREIRWTSKRIDFPLEIRQDLALFVIPLLTLILLLAAFIPSISVRDIVEFARKLTELRSERVDQVSESLGLEFRYEPPTYYDQIRNGGLPRGHLLGAGPELSERVVMIVKVVEDESGVTIRGVPSGMPPEVAEQLSMNAPRYYWRSLTYDLYTGFGWISNDVDIKDYKGGEPAIPVSLPWHRLVIQEIYGVEDLGDLVYSTGFMVAPNVDYQAAWRRPRNMGFPEYKGDLFGATTERNQYRVVSLQPDASIEDLRNAGRVYPEWIAGRYMALPDTVPYRVLTLALDLTAAEPTAYDRAAAIEAYLRTFPYTLDLPAPPLGRDVADYFLFDLQRGYCDYYATAMVVLARAAGLPARIVTGYAQGNYDSRQGGYVVTEADAHSWVEVYFPGVGWAEFEPTAGRPAIEREATQPEDLIPISKAIPPSEIRQPADWTRVTGLSAGLLLLLVLLAVLAQVADTQYLLHKAPVDTAARLYARLRRSGARLAVPTLPGDTPYEYEAAFSRRTAVLPTGKIKGRLFRPIGEEVNRLVDLYARASYSPHPPDTAELRRAIRAWLRLRWRLAFARIVKRR